MNTPATYAPRARFDYSLPALETIAAWLLAVIWIFPLLYAFWAAFHPSEFMVNFDLFAPFTLDNFTNAWAQAPFARYYLNTFALVTGVVLVLDFIATVSYFENVFEVLTVGIGVDVLTDMDTNVSAAVTTALEFPMRMP